VSDSETIPFGKLQGKPIQALDNDPSYALWLAQQPWFREKFSGIFAYVASKFDLDEETPEHNAMQLKWLNRALLSRMIYATYAGDPFDSLEQLESLDGSDIREVAPEQNGWDICFKWQSSPRDINDNFVELKTTLGDNYPAVLRTMNAKKLRNAADPDYFLIVRQLTTKVANVEQLVDFFGASEINFLMERDAECLDRLPGA
jgi:hypothetical protein